jgi:hypothetical protein
VDFVRRWSEKTEIGAGRWIMWFDLTASKFYNWRARYGKVNEHNGWVPRDFWLERLAGDESAVASPLRSVRPFGWHVIRPQAARSVNRGDKGGI